MSSSVLQAPSSGLVYTFGRIVSIGTRPACLLLATNFMGQDLASALAVVYLTSAIGLVAIQADPHRKYYLSLFQEQFETNGYGYYLYCTSVVLLACVGALVVICIVIYSDFSWLIAASAAMYFLSEKVADEVLRIKIYRRDLNGWGRQTSIRGLLQIIGTIILAATIGSDLSAFGVVMLLTVANLVVFCREVAAGTWLIIFRFKTFGWMIGKCMHSIFDNRLLWSIALLGSVFGYFDRLLAMMVEPENLAIFMLVVMCFSVLVMAVDFYFLTPFRRDFLERKITLQGALLSKRFLLSLLASLGVGSVASIVILLTTKGGSEFPLIYLIAACLLQCLIAIVMLPQQILYWHGKLKTMLWIEVFSQVLFGAGIFFLYVTEAISLTNLLFLAMVCGSVRCVLFLKKSQEVNYLKT